MGRWEGGQVAWWPGVRWSLLEALEVIVPIESSHPGRLGLALLGHYGLPAGGAEGAEGGRVVLDRSFTLVFITLFKVTFVQ